MTTLIILSSIFLPLLTVVVLYVFWAKRIHWIETLAVMTVPIVFVLGTNAIVESCQTSATEYLGGYAESASYFERWNEYIHKTCTRQDCSGAGDERVCTTEFYDCSYVEDHPPYWNVKTTVGTLSLAESDFNRLKQRFGNVEFVDMRRSFHTIDGDQYLTKWGGERETLEPITVTSTYENRVQASDSVFKFPVVDPKTFGLFDHPGLWCRYRQQAILGPDVQGKAKAETDLEYWNAVLGGSKQVKMFVIVFKNKPIQAAFDQQAYWKGGNKNEFVTVVGVDDAYTVQWAYVFSWSEAESLKVDAKSFVLDQKALDLPAYVDWLGPEVQKRFVRKRFRDFKYLDVQPPTWYVVTALIVVVLLCVGLGILSVRDELNMEDKLT